MRQRFWWLLIFLFGIAAGMLVGLPVLRSSDPPTDSIAINDLAQLVKDGAITTIAVHHDRATVTGMDGQQYSLRVGQNDTVPGLLRSFGVTPDELAQVTYVVDEPSWFGDWPGLLISLLPLIFTGAILLLLFRQAQGANNQALSLGKSGARRFTGDGATITFQDVAGIEEANRSCRRSSSS